MNGLVRWGRFNLVGAIGMLVQLAALSLFNRLLVGHYLYASAIAVELALLHNFVWHWHYTWRDRRDRVAPLRPLVRFHLSNGLVSLLGNLALTRLLVYHGDLPLLAANGIAILFCSIANFFAGDHWAFAQAQKRDLPGSRLTDTPSASCRVVVLSLLLVSCAIAHGQENPQESSSFHHAGQLPDAPPVQPTAEHYLSRQSERKLPLSRRCLLRDRRERF